MSWSRSAEGTPEEVLAKVREWPNQQTEQDRKYALNAGGIAGHRAETTAAVAAVEQAVVGLGFLPAGLHIKVGAWGHANGDGSGESGINISRYKPLPTEGASTV